MGTTLDHKAYYQIIIDRDAHYDDRFFFAVTTTGIYCRPSCAARRPLEKHCKFFISARTAEAHGFRPCRRCRPNEPKNDLPLSILAQFDELDFSRPRQLAELASTTGISERHLRRLIKQSTGKTPVQLTTEKRLYKAKKMLLTTRLSITDIAYRADFSSLRQFNLIFKKAYSMSPSELRKITNKQPTIEGNL